MENAFSCRSIRLRKALGGGWRQPGMLARAAIFAMRDVRSVIQRDHANAQKVAKGVVLT